MFTRYQNTVFYINIYNFVNYRKKIQILETKLKASKHKPASQPNSGTLLKSRVGVCYPLGRDSGLLTQLPFPVSITWLIFDLVIYFPGTPKPYVLFPHWGQHALVSTVSASLIFSKQSKAPWHLLNPPGVPHCCLLRVAMLCSCL